MIKTTYDSHYFHNLLFTGDVNINDPEGDVYELPGGSTTLVLKCTSDGVDMVWYRDNVLLSSEGSVSIVTILDTAIGFSTLRIDGVNSNSSGRYACRNPARGSDEDVITVTVPAPDRESTYKASKRIPLYLLYES